MKLIRFGTNDNEKPGVQLQDGTRIDVSNFVEDYNEKFFGSGGIQALESWLVDNQAHCAVIDPSVRLGAPLARPSKIVCVGLNYAKHAEESGMEPPKEPVLFFKATSAFSTIITFSAPRDIASKPSEPLPANKSRHLAPDITGDNQLNNVSFTLSGVGLNPSES